MKVLSISTPAKYVSLSLSNVFEDCGTIGQTVLADFSSLSARSEDLTALAEQVFRASKTDIGGTQLISVVRGPGSYSGLRGGLAAAKSFAQVLGIPIIGVSTIETMARGLINLEGTVAVVLDAVKDEYNFGLFAVSRQKMSRLSEDTVLTKDNLRNFLDKFKGAVYVASPFDDIRELSGNANIIHIKTFARAVDAGLAGFEKYNGGKKEDFLTMVPDYSHTPKLKEYK